MSDIGDQVAAAIDQVDPVKVSGIAKTRTGHLAFLRVTVEVVNAERIPADWALAGNLRAAHMIASHVERDHWQRVMVDGSETWPRYSAEESSSDDDG